MSNLNRNIMENAKDLKDHKEAKKVNKHFNVTAVVVLALVGLLGLGIGKACSQTTFNGVPLYDPTLTYAPGDPDMIGHAVPLEASSDSIWVIDKRNDGNLNVIFDGDSIASALKEGLPVFKVENCKPFNYRGHIQRFNVCASSPSLGPVITIKQK